MKSIASLLLLGLLAPVNAIPTVNKRAAPVADHARANKVRLAFKEAWDGYYRHAFPHDTLTPIDNGFIDDRGEWGLTPMDALSTAIVMNEEAIVNQILDFVPTVDFTTTRKVNESISLFESTIRYIGGMVSSYDLLKGPYKRLARDPKKVDALLKQATVLADTLSIAFDTPSGIADGYVILNPERRQSGAKTSGLAEMGTLVLEWTRLSDLTGDPKYAKMTQKCEEHLLHPKGSPEAWPGLPGSEISIATGEFINSSGGWSGGTDSFYEYLVKMYLYDPKEFAEYKDRWILAADNTMKHLASNPTTRKDLTFLKQYNNQQTTASTGHLTSFVGGNFILGGIVFKDQKYIDFGLKLAESYFEPYLQTAAGIGPEVFSWVDSNNATNAPPAGKEEFYKKAGFWTTVGDYVLRPETMESIYYSYRVTGDKKYQDMAWTGFNHIYSKTRTGSGFSGLNDVDKADGGGFDNVQESFFLAETLKYLYLVFTDDSDAQVKAGSPNKFVYNTEAHPVKVRG